MISYLFKQYKNTQSLKPDIEYWGLVSLGGTGRDDISMQFAPRDFRLLWIYTWVKLP